MYCTYETTNLSNGKYYRGYCSSHDLIENSQYKGSGKYLWNSIRKYGWSMFTSKVLQTFNSSEEAYIHEKQIVIVNTDDKMSYNLKPGGLGGWSYINKHVLNERRRGQISVYNEELDIRKYVNRDNIQNLSDDWRVGGRPFNTVWVNQLNEERLIPKHMLSEYRSLGWLIGRKTGYVMMTNGISNKMVQLKDFDSCCLAGWKRGMTRTKYRWVNNGEINLLISVYDKRYKTMQHGRMTNVVKWINNGMVAKIMHINIINEYLSDGWSYGMLPGCHIPVTDMTETKYVSTDDLSTYLDNGWVRGRHTASAIKGHIAVSNIVTKKTIYIMPSDLNSHLNNGYVKGIIDTSNFGQISGYISIHLPNTTKSTRVKPENVHLYLDKGWIRGTGQPGHTKSVGRVYVNNGSISKMIDPTKLDKYLDDGWIRGMYIKPKERKRYMTNDMINKQIPLSKVQDYLNNGWRFGKISRKK